jgi:hypothetical protein
MRLENYLTDFTLQVKLAKIMKNLKAKHDVQLAQKSIQTEDNCDCN